MTLSRKDIELAREGYKKLKAEKHFSGKSIPDKSITEKSTRKAPAKKTPSKDSSSRAVKKTRLAAKRDTDYPSVVSGRAPRRPMTAKLSGGSGAHLVLKEGRNSTEIPLSQPAYEAITKLLEQMGKGKEVIISSVPDEMTTQEAADFLHVSRPFLIGLLEKGEIPFYRVGTHRRLLFSDLQAYKEGIDTKRLKALEELAKQAQELNMGY